jgi:hypothetical protein
VLPDDLAVLSLAWVPAMTIDSHWVPGLPTLTAELHELSYTCAIQIARLFPRMENELYATQFHA